MIIYNQFLSHDKYVPIAVVNRSNNLHSNHCTISKYIVLGLNMQIIDRVIQPSFKSSHAAIIDSTMFRITWIIGIKLGMFVLISKHFPRWFQIC